MGWEASSGFRGVFLIPLRSPSLASSELRNKQPSPPPQKPTLQEKAVGHARTQNFVVYVQCFILVYPGHCRSGRQGGRALPSRGSLGSLCPENGGPDKGMRSAMLWVLMDSRCDVLQSAAPSVKWGFWNSLPSSAALAWALLSCASVATVASPAPAETS